jgi:hypothetical protein
VSLLSQCPFFSSSPHPYNPNLTLIVGVATHYSVHVSGCTFTSMWLHCEFDLVISFRLLSFVIFLFLFLARGLARRVVGWPIKFNILKYAFSPRKRLYVYLTESMPAKARGADSFSRPIGKRDGSLARLGQDTLFGGRSGTITRLGKALIA